jgi:hypothetical protein
MNKIDALRWWQVAIDQFGLAYSPEFQKAAEQAGYVMARFRAPGNVLPDAVPEYSYDDLEYLYNWMNSQKVSTYDYVIETSSDHEGGSYILFTDTTLAVQWKLFFPEYLEERRKNG